MESSFSCESDIKLAETLSDMSPVTDLTHNLKCLSTSMPETPSRRISWSNLFANVNGKLILDSPYVDSPTFEEIAVRKAKEKAKQCKEIRTSLSDSEDDKENLLPDIIKSSAHNLQSETDSQDSGYSSACFRYYNLPMSKTPCGVRSSVFVDENDEDGFEHLFNTDEEVNDEEILALPNTMVSLLTKPLQSDLKAENPTPTTIKKSKLPIRRCLSMEMDSDIDLPVPSHQDIMSGTRNFLNSGVFRNCMDVDDSRKSTFKRPDPPNSYFSLMNKRRKSSPSDKICSESTSKNFMFQRSYSETSATIMHAIQLSDLHPELIGDGSRSYVLPLVKGRHEDLKCISPQTLARVLRGEYSQEIASYTLVDCRYPYEYEGGHIQGSKNIFTKEDILEIFLGNEATFTPDRNVIIFHCEFSSERAPNLCRFLRSKDRERNESSYPKLNHPEIYLLEGGYKEFFRYFRVFCEPQDYKPMKHKDHGFEYRHFRAKSKSWGADSKSRYRLKSGSLHERL